MFPFHNVLYWYSVLTFVCVAQRWKNLMSGQWLVYCCGQRFLCDTDASSGSKEGREETEWEGGGDREQDIRNFHLPFFPKLCPDFPFTTDHKEHTAEDDGLSEMLAGCLYKSCLSTMLIWIGYERGRITAGCIDLLIFPKLKKKGYMCNYFMEQNFIFLYRS